MLLGIVEVDTILHINMLLNMVEGPKFVFNSIHENGFGDVKEAVLHINMVL